MNSESELEDVIEIIFKPAENFYPLHPNFFSILHELFGISGSYIMIMSYIATILSSLPFIVFLLTKKPFGLSLIYCLSGVSLSFYIFFYQESLKNILFPLMPLSILVIIDFPEFFRFISILFTLSLYQVSINEQTLSAYIGLSLFFFIVSSSYIRTVNYFQNRKGVDFKFWYLAVLVLHLSQFFVGRWFALLFNGFVFMSLMFLWGWVLVGHQKIRGEMAHQYHIEKRFRKKNKVT